MKKMIAVFLMVFSVMAGQVAAYACGVGGHGEKTEEGGEGEKA
ncbi:MAG: hypothetical protein MOGMAGMI_00207 [Candidatus Omnitrophica bacterium]|nr:hypothetical protein [Candidatus Omnitrophota bacterium]